MGAGRGDGRAGNGARWIDKIFVNLYIDPSYFQIFVEKAYEIDITFHVSFAEFQGICLEPETEEEKQSREPVSLALTETMRQAI